jgi:O-antigen/teichoic acid export membrane protein
LNVRKSLAWSFGQQATQYVLQFVASIIIARLLTPAEVGVFALALSVSYLLGVLREAGVGQYLIREPDLDDTKIRSAFGVMIIVSWLLGLALLALRGLMARLYDESAMVPVLGVVSITFFIAPLGQPALSLLIREMRFDVLYRISFLSALVGTMTSLSLAYLGFSYFALAWGLIAGTALTSALALLHEPRHVRLMPSLRQWRGVLRFGGLVTAAGLAGATTVAGSKFLLGALQAPGTVALWERAVQIPSMAREALFAPLGRVLFPAYSRAMRAGQPITTPVLRIAGATTVIIWPAFLVIGTLAVPIVVTLFGDNWRTAGEILPSVLLAQALLAALPQPEEILGPAGRVMRLFLLRLYGALVALTFTVIGAAVSLELFAKLLPLTAFLFVLANYFSIRRVCGLSIRKLAPRYVEALLIAAVSVLPAVAVRLLSEQVALGGLLVVAITAPLFWFGAVALLRHDLMNEIRALPFFPSNSLYSALGRWPEKGKH